jgi:hypothetical protein
MRVAGKTQFDPQFGRAVKRIRIVREQNVRHVAPDQVLDLRSIGPVRSPLVMWSR